MTEPTVIADYRGRPLDLDVDFELADHVVLAAPISIARVAQAFKSPEEPGLHLFAIDVRLDVRLALKGPISKELLFRHYDYEVQGVLSGAPRGASGSTGRLGIYFVRGSGGATRSAVDVARPYVSTPWIRTKPERCESDNARVCFAYLLLSCRSVDDVVLFKRSLIVNVSKADSVAGAPATAEILVKQISSGLGTLRASYCQQMAETFPLATPANCLDLFGPPAERTMLEGRVAIAVGHARKFGVSWLEDDLRVSNREERARYRKMMGGSGDARVRDLADWWARERGEP